MLQKDGEKKDRLKMTVAVGMSERSAQKKTRIKKTKQQPKALPFQLHAARRDEYICVFVPCNPIIVVRWEGVGE